ncbi:MAG: glycosyltransferase family 39 protein [Patescibacteria group bacterium]|nr:glycosyltransferase family 39 protein [Patescibacteria group bacterium]
MKFGWFSKNLNNILVLLIALVFFVATSAFNYYTQEDDYVKFLSPDETSNYFFTNHYAQTGQIAVFEPANLVAEEIVHPRSIRSDHGWLKPVSFIGIILVYGKIASVLGVGVIPYLTPFFGALGIIFFYALVRRLLGPKQAIVSALLLASFPVYFFYSSRSMFHNILFTIFLLGFTLFASLSIIPRDLLQKIKKDKNFWRLKLVRAEILSYLAALMAGLMLGGAITARTSELLWLGPALFILWLFYARRLAFTRLILMLSAVILALLPLFYWNQILYSSPFFGGYGEMNRSIVQLSQAGGQFVQSTVTGHFTQYKSAANTIWQNIFYFGYHPRQSLWMFYHYVLAMFPVLCSLTFLGGIFLLFKLAKKQQRWIYAYLVAWFILSSLLVLYYGSWKFNDNPDPTRFTIGNSYTRYWLPVYIMAIPLASLAITSLAKLFANLMSLRSDFKWSRGIKRSLESTWVIVISGVLVFIFSIFTFFGSEEGLAILYYNHFTDRNNTLSILNETEANSIIITQYHDKQLFPERRVVNALLTNDDVNASIGALLKEYPVYYYNFFFPPKDLQYLNERRLPPYGFKIELLERRGPFGLYRLDSIATSSPIIQAGTIVTE